MADGEYWDFLDEGGYEGGGGDEPIDFSGIPGVGPDEGGGEPGGYYWDPDIGDYVPIDFSGVPGDEGGGGDVPEGWYFNGVTGNYEDPEGNQWQFNNTYGYVPADWKPIPDDFQYDDNGKVYDAGGNPMYLDDKYGWLPEAWQGGNGQFDPKLYEQTTGSKPGPTGPKEARPPVEKKPAPGGGGPGGGAGTGIGSPPKAGTSSSSSSSLDSLTKGLGSIASPLLGALGISNSGSLNPSGDYNKGNIKQKTTYVGTDPTQSGAMGQLFNAYAAGAVGNQKLRDEILRGTPDNPGLLSTLNQYQTNPVQDFGGGANEFTTLGTYNDFMSGRPTANEGFVTEGYKSAYEQPESVYDRGAADVYGRAAGGPSEAADTLYSDTQKYGGEVTPDEAQIRETYTKMITEGGYDPETARNIIATTLEGARAPFANAARANERRALATGNQLVATAGAGGLARDQAQAMTLAGRQAEEDIAKEKIRQREAGATGLSGLLNAANARKQYALGARTGQLGQQQQFELAGAGGLSNLGQNLFGRKMTGLSGTSGQNQLARTYRMQGTQGAQDWYNQMFGRRMAGTTGMQNLWNTAQGADLAYLGGAANVGSRPIEQYTETGGQRMSTTGGPTSARPFFPGTSTKTGTTGTGGTNPPTGSPYDPNEIDLNNIYGIE